MVFRKWSTVVVLFCVAFLAGCGGGGDGQVNNPVPLLTSLSPASATAGDAALTVTANGSNFVATSVVRWNGVDRTSTFVSASELQAAILGSDLLTTGTAEVTAFNPAPGGGTSSALTFTISTPPPGVIERVSVNTDGSQGTSLSIGSVGPSLSAGDARYVAFQSTATNLVADDTNAGTDIFVRDTCTGAPAGCTRSTIRVSVATDGSQSFGSSFQPRISADGRFVAFSSTAGNLVADDSNGARDTFVRDTCVGAQTGCSPSTIRVSVASDGTQGNSSSNFKTSISADGRFVAFSSRASNLVTGDTNGFSDIFVRDTCAGATGCTPTTIRVSVADDGTQGDSFVRFFSSLSADGRFVAFSSTASNLVAADTNGTEDVFVRDTCGGATGCTPTTIRISVADDGTQGNFESFDPWLSADGRFVAFSSNANTLVVGDTNAVRDIFVRDTCAGAVGCSPTTIRVSVAGDGTQGNFLSALPSISADGRFVSFASLASTLVVGDTNDTEDVFVRDTCVGAPTGCTPSTIRISMAGDGTQGNDSSLASSISADGRLIAFYSLASNLVAGDTNNEFDVFFGRTGF